MIALPAKRRKCRFGGADRRYRRGRPIWIPSRNRWQNPYCRPISAHSRPLCPAIVHLCVGPIRSVLDSSAPSPRVRLGRACTPRIIPSYGWRFAGHFLLSIFLLSFGSVVPGRRCAAARSVQRSQCSVVSAAWSVPHRAWCRDDRDCRSAQTPPRHRHPRRRDFPAAHSNAPAGRANRRA